MKRALVFLLLSGVLAGCSGVGSVYPICTVYDTVTVKDVLGTWTDKETGGLLVISPDPSGAQKLRIREKDGSLTSFDLQLTRIGGALFGDLRAADGSKDAPLSTPIHLFARVELKESTLKLYFPDFKWFEARLDRHPSAIHHIKQYAKGEEGWIYLTDDTKSVRSFLKKCAKSPEAFVEGMALTKVSESQGLPPAVPPAEAENSGGPEPGK